MNSTSKLVLFSIGALAAFSSALAGDLESRACSLVTLHVDQAENAISPLYGDLPTASPRLARLIQSGILTRAVFSESNAYTTVRERIIQAGDWTDEEVIHLMNAGRLNPSTIGAMDGKIMITGSVRRRGDTLTVKIGKLRKMDLNWADESSGVSNTVVNLIASVMDGIRVQLEAASKSTAPIRTVKIIAGAVANKKLEEMFIRLGFAYDSKMVEAAARRKANPALRMMDEKSAWIDQNIMREKPHPNQGSNMDLVLEFHPSQSPSTSLGVSH